MKYALVKIILLLQIKIGKLSKIPCRMKKASILVLFVINSVVSKSVVSEVRETIVRVGNFYTILFFTELTSLILFVVSNLVYRIYSIRCQYGCFSQGATKF